MFSLSMFQVLTESSSGYYGGPAIDTMPYMDADTLISRLPVAIMESHMELLSNHERDNELLVEAAVSAITTGISPNYGPIVEGAWESLKTHIKQFWDKIIKFLSSIIAKLKVQYDKMTMKGRTLYSKYRDKPEANKDFTGLTCQGFKFEHGQRPLGDLSKYADINGMKELFRAAAGEEIEDPDKMFSLDRGTLAKDSPELKAATEKSEKITGLGVEECQYKMASKIIGNVATTTQSDWVKDLTKALYGEKSEIKFGSETFTKEWIGDLLGKADCLTQITKDYENMRVSAENYKKTLENWITKFEAQKTKNFDEEPKYPQNPSEEQKKKADKDRDDSVNGKNNALQATISYFKAYQGLCEHGITVVNTLMKIEKDYEEARLKQAQTFFGKMLTFKEKKENSDAAYYEDLVILDAEL